MKKIFFLSLILVSTLILHAQIKSPATFKFEAKKKSANTYELVTTVTLENHWHIYSQNTGDGGPIPTAFTFKKNPLLIIEGKAKETGKLVKTFDKNFNTDVLFYSNKVEFTQTVKVKGNAKTTLSGTIEYQLCDDSKCLIPTKKTFDIKLL